MTAAAVRRALTPPRRRPARARENPEFAEFARRIIDAHGRRVATGDIEGLAALAALADDLDIAMRGAVDGLRDAGYSWSDIAARLGTTRQSAHERYRRPAEKPTAGGETRG